MSTAKTFFTCKSSAGLPLPRRKSRRRGRTSTCDGATPTEERGQHLVLEWQYTPIA